MEEPINSKGGLRLSDFWDSVVLIDEEVAEFEPEPINFWGLSLILQQLKESQSLWVFLCSFTTSSSASLSIIPSPGTNSGVSKCREHKVGGGRHEKTLLSKSQTKNWPVLWGALGQYSPKIPDVFAVQRPSRVSFLRSE